MTATSSRPAVVRPTPLRLDGVGFTYPTRPDHRVLTDVTLTVGAGERIGLIGENGSGKSTLLRIGAGRLAPDRGAVHRPDDVGLLHQQAPHDAAATVGSVVEDAVAEVRALAGRIEDLAEQLADGNPAVAEAWDAVLREADRTGLWTLDARVAAVLTGLGLADLPPERPVTGISGGERRRLQLAALLLARPEALLLDEPTNHLDDGAMDFLVRELTAWRGAVLIASHDRWFLDAVATGIVDLDPGLDPDGAGGHRQGTAWTGGYSDYLRARARARRRWADRYADQEEQRARLEEAAGLGEGDIFHRSTSKSETRASAKFSADRAAKTLGNRVHAARNRLDALERDAIVAPPAPLRLAALSAVGKDAVRTGADDASTLIRGRAVAVPGRLDPVDVDLRAGDHLLLTGPNGAGKSTLLAVLAGRLPASGELDRQEGLAVATLSQHDLDPDGAVTAVEAFEAALAPGARARAAGAVPGPVELGLLAAEDLNRPLRDLSPGQRRRVALAAVLACPPDVLLLDEPTNHLALGLVEDLEAALAAWNGTVVLATHDRWLRERWTGRRLVLDAG
ncbi:ATP-binding cassette domain-containing protein [Tersicoccus sp. MR15.9]|uniref:ABC-F family ATP-binding cassette domain-containing protein n=1 Tax=Tersicoccus mangrovi TaxID=3121635 RepID=UPI002FE580CB